uniref:Uncharacterized protein n=1 Tax=viral metagenome TaxID=1070528 RepID=A0A6C0AYZ8_9ZZZZ
MYKSFVRKNNITIAILLFLIIFIIFVKLKPHFLFNRNGSIRNFGLGKSSCSILPIWLLVIIIAIVSYLFVLYYLTL